MRSGPGTPATGPAEGTRQSKERTKRTPKPVLVVYGDGKSQEKAILSFHALGEGFYLATVILPGGPIHYGVLDARSKDKLPLALLECSSTTPPDLVPAPDAEAFERCKAADRERLTAIANRFKADMMANRIPASKLFEYTRIP